MPIQKGDTDTARKLAHLRWAKRKESTNNAHIDIKISDLDLTNPLHLETLNQRVLTYLLEHRELNNNEIKRLRMVLSILRNQSKLLGIRRGQELEQKADELRKFVEEQKNMQSGNKFFG